MKPHDIVLFPESVLRQKAAEVKSFDAALTKLVNDLTVTMQSQKHGIGIAAPQIGVPLQVAIVDISQRNPGAKRLVLVNPKILRHSEARLVSREGCMSLPDYTADLNRWEWVEISWFDEKGKHHKGKFQGIEGICVQHEIDHLQGKLFLDRVACLKTDMFARHLKKPKKKH